MSVSDNGVFFVEEVMEIIGSDITLDIDSDDLREMAHLLGTGEISPEDAFGTLMTAADALEQREMALYETTRDAVIEHLQAAFCEGGFWDWAVDWDMITEDISSMLVDMGMDNVYQGDGGLEESCPSCDLSPSDHLEVSQLLIEKEAELIKIRVELETSEKNSLVYRIKLRKLQGQRR
jgi:hypothetical protein